MHKMHTQFKYRVFMCGNNLGWSGFVPFEFVLSQIEARLNT